jgi:hypothetical protein
MWWRIAATVAEPFGTVGRLQVHRAAVKSNAVYNPAPLATVDQASFDSGGMIGWDGRSWFLDNHHRSYPYGRPAERRAVSVGFTAHYAAMYDRFGDTVVPGVAAENIVIDAVGPMSLERLGSGLDIRSSTGESLALREPLVAAPCREFTSCLLGLSERGSREELADDLAFLDDGMRGFVFGTATIVEPILISVGDPVYLAP